MTTFKHVDNKNASDYESLLKSGKPSDVVLAAGGKEIRAHKSILSAGSPVFSAMFAHSSTKESQENRVEIIDVDVEFLELLVRYTYTGKVGTLGQYTADLFVAADKYQMDSLKAICGQQLLSQITVESFADLFILAEMFQVTELTTKCVEFYLKNCPQVVDSKGWKTFVAREDFKDLYAKLYSKLFVRLHVDYSKLIKDKKKVESKKKRIDYRALIDSWTPRTDLDFEKDLLKYSNVINCKEVMPDAVLLVGNKDPSILRKFELKVHKSILSTRSPVFAGLFAHDSILENRVKITDMDVEVLKFLIKYIYSDKVEGLDRYAMELFVAADKYQLDGLKSICEKQLLSQTITTESVCDLLILADIHQITELYTKCVDYIIVNGTQVIASEGWKKIRVKTDLLAILCERLNLNFSEQLLLSPITIGSVSNLVILADMHKITELTTKCFDYIIDNVTQVMQQEDWKKIAVRADLVFNLFQHLSSKYTRVREKILEDQRTAKRIAEQSAKRKRDYDAIRRYEDYYDFYDSYNDPHTDSD